MQSILKTLLIIVISLSGFVLLAEEQNRPNVLIIMADDCTYNDLSLYGGVNAKTPHIERLASGGLVFEQAYLCGRCASHVGQNCSRGNIQWPTEVRTTTPRVVPAYVAFRTI